MKVSNTVVGVWAHSLNCEEGQAQGIEIRGWQQRQAIIIAEGMRQISSERQLPSYAHYVADCSQKWHSGI